MDEFVGRVMLRDNGTPFGVVSRASKVSLWVGESRFVPDGPGFRLYGDRSFRGLFVVEGTPLAIRREDDRRRLADAQRLRTLRVATLERCREYLATLSSEADLDAAVARLVGGAG